MLISVYALSLVCFRSTTTIVANLNGVDRIAYYACGCIIGGISALLTLIHTIHGLVVAAVVQGVFIGKIHIQQHFDDSYEIDNMCNSGYKHVEINLIIQAIYRYNTRQ